MFRITSYNVCYTKLLRDRWVKWVVPEVDFAADGKYFEIPATLVWSGKPDTWDPKNPSLNPGLTVSIKDKGQDLGVARITSYNVCYTKLLRSVKIRLAYNTKSS